MAMTTDLGREMAVAREAARLAGAYLVEQLAMAHVQGDKAARDAIREVDAAHRYTPRTILRRILDHSLDHLNQVEQWLAWREQGVTPTPTDGWVSSAQTLLEDRAPISPEDLNAWLWRIDVTAGLLAQRAQTLTEDQLDWPPPAGGWTLRRMLRHVASAERYYAVWLDDTFSDEPGDRYHEANSRFVSQLRHVLAHPAAAGEALFSGGNATTTAVEVAEALLDAEQVAWD
jgi:hypothetical protein